MLFVGTLRHGRPPLSVEALLSSANFTLSLLPVRLAHRLQALRNLPFIVVSNPHISIIYKNYLHSLSTLLPYTEGGRRITKLQDESSFTEVLADLVQTHSNTIPTLARGFLECRKYISPIEVTRFLDEHLRARIGTRLIAEQHLALHFSSQPHLKAKTKGQRDESASSSGSRPPSSYIGVIDTALKPARVIEYCGSFVSETCELTYGVRPSLVIDGQPDMTFAFVPVHLEYIITELLKNAFRAVVESGMQREPVVITIAAAPNDDDSEGGGGIMNRNDDDKEIRPGQSVAGTNKEMLLPVLDQVSSSSAAAAAPGVTIRIRDRGGGISAENLPKIWSYSFTTFNSPSSLSSSSSSSSATTPSNDDDDAAIGNIITTSSSTSPNTTIAGLGYGLPLSRAYAEYFGGRIDVQTMWGWGTDVYLRLRGVR